MLHCKIITKYSIDFLRSICVSSSFITFPLPTFAVFVLSLFSNFFLINNAYKRMSKENRVILWIIRYFSQHSFALSNLSFAVHRRVEREHSTFPRRQLNDFISSVQFLCHNCIFQLEGRFQKCHFDDRGSAWSRVWVTPMNPKNVVDHGRMWWWARVKKLSFLFALFLHPVRR